jgi:uncharacterized SAM-binding protein YcdF (DUF218 family)
MRVLVRSVFAVATATSIAIAGYLILTFVSILGVGHSSDIASADAVVVLGAAQYDGTPSPLLESRLQHALNVYKQGRAQFIVVTGGKRNGDRFTEAAASRRWLTDRKVSAARIILEDRGHSTWESLSALPALLKSFNIQSLLVSTDRWHVQRCVLSLRQLGFTAYSSPVTTSPLQGFNRAWGKYLKETAGVAVGRVTGFDTLLSITG